MRATLIFEDAEAFQRIAVAIEITAAIEGGAGAVKLGVPARLADGRWILSHPFAAVDADWILAYADDPEISIEWETT